MSSEMELLLQRMDGPGPEPPRKPGFCARNRKRVVIVVVIAVLLLAALALLGVFVALPRIAQSMVDGASLSFDSVRVGDIAASSLSLSASGCLSSTGAVSASLAATNLTLSFSGALMGHVLFPAMRTATSGPTCFRVAQRLRLQDAQVFARFAELALTAPTVVLRVDALLDVTALGVSIKGVRLSKNVTLRGFGGFSDVSISRFGLYGGSRDTGVQVFSDVLIVSPSQLAMSLGNVTMELLYKGHAMGRVSTHDMAIREGKNSLAASGILKPSDVNATNELLSQFMRGEPSLVAVRGVSVEGAPKWLEGLISKFQVLASLPGATADQQNMLRDVVFKSMALSTSASGPLLSSTIEARMQPPFPMYLALQRVRASLDLMLGGVLKVGTLDIPWMPVEQSGLNVSLALHDVRGSFSQHGLRALTQALLEEEVFSLSAIGPSCVVADTFLGVLTISGFPLRITPAPLAGLGGRVSRVTRFSLPGQTRSGVNVSATASMENPTVFSLDLGRVLFDMRYGEQSLGTAEAHVLVTRNSLNSITMRGVVEPQGAAALDAAGDFVSAYLRGEASLLTVHGLHSLDNSSPEIAAIVGAIELRSIVQAAGPFDLVRSIALESGSLFVTAGGGGRVQTSMLLDGRFRSPWPAVTLRVESLGMRANETLPGTGIMGYFSVDPAQANITQTGDPLHVKVGVSNVPLGYFEAAKFANFTKELFQSVSLNVGIEARSELRAALAFGTVTLRDIPVSTKVLFVGVNSFRNPAIRVDKMAILSASATSVSAFLTLSVYNPSNVALSIPRLSMDLWVRGAYLGTGLIGPDPKTNSVFLGHGWNTYQARASVLKTPHNDVARRLLFSNFLSQVATNVTLKGSQNSSDIPILQPALASLLSESSIAGIAAPLIVSARLGIRLKLFRPVITMKITNPFGVSARITDLSMSVNYKGTHDIGSMDNLPAPISVPANSTIEAKVTAKISVKAAVTLWGLLTKGKIDLSAHGWMDVVLGGVYKEDRLPYTQRVIPTTLFKA